MEHFFNKEQALGWAEEMSKNLSIDFCVAEIAPCKFVCATAEKIDFYYPGTDKIHPGIFV